MNCRCQVVWNNSCYEQLTLNFPQRRNCWPQCIRSWMRDANAYGNNFSWAAWCNPFYPFKDRLLWKHGTFLGYNIQRIKRECNRCGGTGNFLYWTDSSYKKCWCCNGTGLYRIDYHLLERYLLFGDIYHKPIRLADVKRFGAIGPLIKGKIEHKHMSARHAWISFLMLAFLFDQSVFRKESKRIAGNIRRHYWRNFNRAFDKFAIAYSEAYKIQFHCGSRHEELPF
jgi:hypothetical protein